MRAFLSAIVLVVLLSSAEAQEPCPDNDRMMAAGREVDRLASLIEKGDCSLIDRAMSKLEEVNRAANAASRNCEYKVIPGRITAAQQRAEFLADCQRAAAAIQRQRSNSTVGAGTQQNLHSRTMVQGQQSVSCSTITDSSHPSSGPCRQANSALQIARSSGTTNSAMARDRYERAAELFRLAGDFVQQIDVLLEGGLPLNKATGGCAEYRRRTEIGRNVCRVCQGTSEDDHGR
jgi:hypothetical protein